MSDSLLLIERHERVALIRLNRPDAMNALSFDLREHLQRALLDVSADDSVAVIVITGNDQVFAAGADIKAIKDWTYSDALYSRELRGAWEQLGRCHKPVIAAVAGHALGAGCELAMMCDFILAADNAQFGQPEIRLGMVPGSGGTQRLTRLVGKSKAMEMILSGRTMDAAEAERCGLVSRVVPLANLIPEALKVATTISRFSGPILRMAKAAVNASLETHLAEGLRQEARFFEEAFRTEDRREGAYAFIEKRRPVFTQR